MKRNMFSFSDALDFDLCSLKDQNQVALFIIVLMIKHPIRHATLLVFCLFIHFTTSTG